MNNQKLSHGYVCGINNVSVTKILYWQKSKAINWMAFLWYIADFATIVDFGENWFKVNIVSDKQLDFFYNKVIEYAPDICEHNYDVDITNELWKTHKKYADKNFDILKKLTVAK